MWERCSRCFSMKVTRTENPFNSQKKNVSNGGMLRPPMRVGKRVQLEFKYNEDRSYILLLL